MSAYLGFIFKFMIFVCDFVATYKKILGLLLFISSTAFQCCCFCFYISFVTVMQLHIRIIIFFLNYMYIQISSKSNVTIISRHHSTVLSHCQFDKQIHIDKNCH